MVFESVDRSEPTWAGKTYIEINDLASDSGSIAVVPVGSIEQHGNHLPVATDTILVDAVAKAGAAEVADEIPILVTPPVWGGLSPHHLPFGGTISIPFETLLKLVENIAESLIDNGFDAVLILNGHGGNASLIDAAVTTVGDAHPDVDVLSLSYFRLAEGFIDDVRESQSGGMAHAGEFETSLMLHLRPDLVQTDQLEGTYRAEAYDLGRQDLFDGGALTVFRTYDELTDSGAAGDPELASEEKGEQIFDHVCEELEALLKNIHEQSDR